jgi:tetratricopeptide (TPR) repeat protein
MLHSIVLSNLLLIPGRKSQLALEYCCRAREQSPDAWCFWVCASNTARLRHSFAEIARLLKLRGHDNLTANPMVLLKAWMDNNGPWTLVIDNVDDPIVLELEADSALERSGAQEHLKRFLSTNPSGRIIVTSRSEDVAEQLVREQQIIKINPMKGESTAALFRKKLGEAIDVTDDHVSELSRALEYMPLAVVQAAAYIKKLCGRITVEQYIRRYRQDDNKRKRLLATKGMRYASETKDSNSIMTTYSISFEYLKSHHETAVILLRLMSFFDRQGIQESLLRTRAKPGWEGSCDDKCQDHTYYAHEWNHVGGNWDVDDHEPGAMDVSQFTQDLVTLRDFTFVTWKKENPDIFHMHALVQFATRQDLEADSSEHARIHALSIRKLYTAFPFVKFDHWNACRSFYPHVVAGMNRPPKDDETLEKWISVMSKAAILDYNMGRAKEGTMINNKALKTSQQLFGLDDQRTLHTCDTAAGLLILEGRWSEAEMIFEQQLDISRETLGMNRKGTIIRMIGLAGIYIRRHKWDLAEKLLMETGPLCKTKEHRCEVGDCLSQVYAATVRPKEGLEILGQVLAMRRTIEGAEQHVTWRAMNNLAGAHADLGQYKEAAALVTEAIELCSPVLGKEHPYTLQFRSNLGGYLIELGRIDEADEILRETWKLQCKVMGEKHEGTLLTMYTGARVMLMKGEHQDAVKMAEEYIRLMTEAYGVDHPWVVRATGNLNEFKWSNEKDAESIEGKEQKMSQEGEGPSQVH